jgi:phage terminase large subunit-like protein
VAGTEEQKDGEPTQAAKDKSTERIDGIVATIMAIGRAMLAQEEPQPEYSLHFV